MTITFKDEQTREYFESQLWARLMNRPRVTLESARAAILRNRKAYTKDGLKEAIRTIRQAQAAIRND